MHIDDIEIDWGSSILIPEGKYQVTYFSHEATNGSFGPKLKITFKINTFGEFYGKFIDSWYNLPSGSKTGKGRGVKTPSGSKLTSDLLKVLGPKARIDRLSVTGFKGKLIWVKVRTVLKNGRQQKMHELQRYSIVDSIIGESDASELTNTPAPRLEPKLEPIPIPVPTPTIKSANES
jgi:hypothetical protein